MTIKALLFDSLDDGNPKDPPEGYTKPAGSDNARIGSGLWYLAGATEAMWYDDTILTGTTIAARITLPDPVSPSAVGVGIIDSSGNGYEVITGTTAGNFRVFAVLNGKLNGGALSGGTYAVAPVAEAVIELSHTGTTLTIKQGDSILGTVTGITRPTNPRAAASSRGGYVVAMESEYEPAQVITSINGGNPILVGQTSINVPHTGFTGAITAVTASDSRITCNIVSGDSSATVFGIGGWETGEEYPELDANITFTFSRPGESASAAQTVTRPSGWEKVVFTAAITDDPTLITYDFEQAGHTAQDAIFYHNSPGDLVINPDGGDETTDEEVVTGWLLPTAGPTAGEMSEWTFTINEAGVIDAEIASVGTVRIGGTTPIAVANFGGAVNAGTLDGKALAAASNTSITMAALANGVATYRPGTRALSLTDGTDTATSNEGVLPPTGWGSYAITAEFVQAINGVAASYLPGGWAVTDFILYPISPSAGKTTTVGDSGVVTGNVGTQQLFLVDAVTGMAAAFNVTTTAGAGSIGSGGSNFIKGKFLKGEYL